MERPKISVIIPAYNEAKLITGTLEALKSQTYPAELFELIVVDNDSQDKTADIARLHQANVVHYADKHTIGAVRNAGAAQASGQILAFIDADSAAAPNWLETIARDFQDPKLMMVGGRGAPREKSRIQSIIYVIYDAFMIANQKLGKSITTGYNMIARRSAFEAVEGFNEDLKATEDLDLGLRIEKKFGKHSTLYDPKVLVYTSTRKMSTPRYFAKYLWDNSFNYINVVWLGKIKSRQMFYVR